MNRSLENEFIKLSTKFLFVCSDKTVSAEELNEILDQLNSLDYKQEQIAHSKAILRLIESFQNIRENEDSLIVKCCCLMKTLISRQKLIIPEHVAVVVIEWILRCLQKCFYSILCESLDVLSKIFKRDSQVSLRYSEKLLSKEGILIKLLENHSYRGGNESENFDNNSPGEIYNSVFNCTESILGHFADTSLDFEIGDEILDNLGKTIVQVFFNLNKDELRENQFYNIITSGLNCLRFICQENSNFSSENVGELWGIAKNFMLFGLLDYEYQLPQKIMPSQQGILEPQCTKPNKMNGRAVKFKKAKQTKHKKPDKKKPRDTQNEENFKQPYSANSINLDEIVAITNQSYRTSDSDFSDMEKNRAFVSRDKQSKIRQMALLLVSAIAQTTEKRVIFGYWHSMFPMEDTTASLLNTLLKDPSSKSKIIALQAISFLLHGSKPFLYQADNREKPSSFTPFSVALANTITSMYEKITQALVKEADLTVLAQILKCLTVFVRVTPFHRLQDGIVRNFMKFIRLLIRHRNPTLKVTALSVMGHLISISDITTEIYELVEIPKTSVKFDRKNIDASIRRTTAADDDEEMIDLDLDEEIEEEIEEPELKEQSSIQRKPMPWLLQIVVENLGVTSMGNQIQASPATSVRTESLQVLSAMSAHFLLIKNNLEFIQKALVNSLRDPIADVRLYANRALDLIGQSMNGYLAAQENLLAEDLESSIKFWTSVLPLVTELVQDINTCASIRAAGCDALANIGVLVFEKLPHEKHILLISILSGCGYDEDKTLRVNAIRTLAVYSVYPTLREDICFIENTIEAILRILQEEDVLYVKLKASWSLGNVVDSLLMTKDNKDVGKINENLLRQMLEANLAETKNHEKVKVNAVRTIGQILQLITSENLAKPEWIQLFEKSVKTIDFNLLNSTMSKLKWNAAVSFGCLMKNQLFFEDKFRNKWQMVVFPSLCKIIRTSPNYKVRINATAAITTPQKRVEFGVYFNEIWCTLLMALEQSNHLIDFSEYKHRDNLQEQLCTSLSSLLLLLQPEDAIAMKNELVPMIDITKQNWNRVLNLLLPEKSSILLSVGAKLEKLKDDCLVPEQKNALAVISSCFKSAEQSF